MGRPRKAAVPPPGGAQETGDELEMGMDTPGAQEAAEGAQEAAKSAGTGQIIGPEDASELLGCQEDEAVLQEGLLTEYAVTAKGGLKLRTGPGLDARVIAVLPFGAGVYTDGEPMGGWLQVRTGRLEGWMMAAHLDPLPLPALASGDV